MFIFMRGLKAYVKWELRSVILNALPQEDVAWEMHPGLVDIIVVWNWVSLMQRTLCSAVDVRRIPIYSQLFTAIGTLGNWFVHECIKCERYLPELLTHPPRSKYQTMWPKKR